MPCQALGLGKPLLLSGLRFPICVGTTELPRLCLSSACNTWTRREGGCLHNVEAGEVGAGDRLGLAGGGRAGSPRAAPARRQPPAASRLLALPRLRAGPLPRRPFICALAAGTCRPSSPSSDPPAASRRYPTRREWEGRAACGGAAPTRRGGARGAAGSPELCVSVRVWGGSRGEGGHRQDRAAGAGASPDSRGNQLEGGPPLRKWEQEGEAER